ncbi:signal peptidase I [Hathewaya limosa]|uniref:Signal peptidase I n=1 Tax=Hathewaya limosa TaxID=1536 RepID=A0ABU0JTR6_HATLI|nr:signal peptidase I [Hathewaya limosa]MDQ0480496.1 signal peptidase I [Hathewaya limosa]
MDKDNSNNIDNINESSDRSRDGVFRGRKVNEKKGVKYYLKEWILPIAIAFVLAMIIHKTWFYLIKIPSGSMRPTIMEGDKILVTRVHNTDKLKRGDIIVFHSDELQLDLIKRLIGLPGDRIEIKENGDLYINGQKQNEPYVVNQLGIESKFEVPEDKFLFLGDNRANSKDARLWDEPYISKDKVMGKAQFIVTPIKRFGKLK